MLDFFRENPRAFIAAVFVHLVLLAVLVFSLDWTPNVSLKGEKKDAPVQAVVIDATQVDAEVERQKQLEQDKIAAEQRRVEEMQRQADEAKATREREERRVAELKAKQEAEQRKAEEAKKLAALEAKRKTEAEAEAKRKAEAEAKRKAEEEARKKAEAEAKRKAEEEAMRKAEEDARKKAEAEKRRLAEEALAASLAEEEARLSAERAAANQRAINQHAALIKAKVQRSWIRPPGSGAELTCLVSVRLIPSGEVVDVSIVRGSGDAAFDRSVEAAVFKASPLPVPQDPSLMEQFRSFRFEFKPS